jgi:hypothetical protein
MRNAPGGGITGRGVFPRQRQVGREESQDLGMLTGESRRAEITRTSACTKEVQSRVRPWEARDSRWRALADSSRTNGRLPVGFV